MTLDIANAPSKEEILEAIEDAERCVTLWRKRALYAAVAFSFSCALVYPFLAGQALHAHWESLGKYLLLLSMALLPVFACSAGAWWSAWNQFRDLEKTYTSAE
jgi:hypothetical protein